MEYSGLAIESPNIQSDAQAVIMRQAQRKANKVKRAKDAETLRLEGNEMFMRGNYLKAADLYVLAVLETHGPKPLLMSNLSAAYLKLEAYDQAEWAATAALEYDPQHLKARFRRGLARKATYAFKAASTDFETVLHYDPHNKDAKEELAIVRDLLRAGEGRQLIDEDDGYPKGDETPWASYSDSDTPDCKHKGIRKAPCRHYNHSGCDLGSACEYSHAPDDKSVRDELGRNVCTHRLLNNCRYGAEKCVYSHDFTYLPDNGWWNYPEQIASAKKLQPLLNEGIFGDEPSAILRAQPKAKKFAARLKSLDVVEELDFRHRLVVRDLQKSASQPLKPSPVEKFVLLISLEEDFFTDIHEHFLSALKQKVKVARALTVQQAMQDLDSTDLIAVYLTDAGAARPKHRVLVTKLVAYTKNGGTVVAGGQFSNHIVPAEFSEFTKAWNLAWNFGSYHRTTFSLNPTNEIVKRNSSLSPSYSMKTLHASKILPEHAIYLPTESSYLQSLVFAPTKIQDKGEAPVVQAKVGRGWFGFIGDVNGEVESTNTVLAMLGLLDHASETLQGGIRQDGSDAPSVSKKTHSKKKNGKAKKSVRRTLAGSSSNEVMPPRSGAERQLSKALPLSESSSKDKPLVVVVALTNFDLFQDAHADQISALQRFAEIKISRTAEDLIEQFSRPNLHGIYITDRGIVQQVNAHVLHKVEEYTTKHGGTVVIGGLFAGTAHPADFSALFSALGLPWTRGAYFRDKVVLNPMHPIATKYGRGLPGELSMKAVHVNSLNLEDGLYFGHAEASLKNESPVLQVSVGDRKKRGRIGFIGDVNAEEGTETILLALFGLLPIVKEPPAPYQKKFIIVLSWVIPFDSQEETTFLDYVKSQEIETVVGLSNARVVELLKSSDLAGVMVADAAICKPENAYLLLQLKDYTLSGGTVVFGRFFATTMMANEVRSFFHDNWAFEWNFALMEDAEVARNEKSQLVQQLEDSKLPKAFNVHGVYLEGITEEMALYSTSGCPRLWNADDMVFMSAFVYAKINAKGGHIGFLGDSRLDGENRSILCAMLGIS